MYVEDISDKQLNDFFLEDASLMYLGLSDEEIVSVYKNGKYPKGDSSLYKGVFLENVLIYVFKYEMFTNITINLHGYLKTSFQKKNLVSNIAKVVSAWCIKKGIVKVLLMVPGDCDHVHRMAERLNFKQEGYLTNCYNWRQKCNDIVIYALNLLEE